MTPAAVPGLAQALKVALSLPVLGFLPGYLLLNGVPTDGRGRPGLRAFERVLVGVFLSLALTSVLALLLAQAGRFDIDLVALILGGVAIAAWRLGPQRDSRSLRDAETEPGEGGAGLSVIFLCVVLVLAAAVFTPPFQTTLWAGDSTLYVGYGVQIGRTGSYAFEDPLLDVIPVDAREELFRNQANKDKTGRRARFPGGIGFVDIEAGRVAPGFSPLFPIWLAIFAQLFGASQVFWVSSFFGVGAVAAVFCLGRELHSPQAGLFASLWLLACMPQIWFSRLPMSETLSQFFLLGGLWMVLLYLRTENRVVGAAAGFVLGVAGLTGFDVVITTSAGILAFVGAALVAGRRIENARYFVAGYAAVLLYGLAHLVYYPSNYAAFFEERLPRLPFGGAIVSTLETAAAGVWLAVGFAVLAISLVVATALARRFIGNPRTRARLAAASLGGALGFYVAGYVLASLPRYQDTLRWFPAYLSWPVMGLFSVSLVGIVLRRIVAARDPDAVALLAGFAVASVPVVYNPQLQNYGIHLGTMRRFVPFLIPGILIVAAVGFAWFVGRLSVGARRITAPLGVALVLALIAQPSMSVVSNRLWDNGVAESAELAAVFPPGAVILVSPELIGVQVQSALTFWYGYGGVALNRSYAIDRLVEDQVVRWLRAGRDVFLLNAATDLHFDGSDLSLSEHAGDDLELRTLADSSWVPYGIEVRYVSMTAYRFELDLTPKTDVNVGSYASDALFPLTGFYGAEADAAVGRYRWTGASASIEIPEARRVTLVLQGARPLGVASAVVSIRANGRLVVEDTTISDEPTRVSLDLGELDLAGPVTITIESSTFTPRRLGLSDDSRELGVRVYRIDFER